MSFERISIGENVTLFRGDCLEVLPGLAAGSVDAVVTDPPYPEDGRFTSDYGFLRDFSLASVIPAKADCWFTSDFLRTRLPKYLAAYSGAWEYYDMLAQITNNSMAQSAFGFDKFAPTLVFRRGKPSIYYRGGNVTTVSRTSAKAFEFSHPSPKNEYTYTKLIRMFVGAFGTILDPFMGSGTTGVAAVKLGRRFIGIEIEQKYFDIAVRRITEAVNENALFEKPKKASFPALFGDGVTA